MIIPWDAFSWPVNPIHGVDTLWWQHRNAASHIPRTGHVWVLHHVHHIVAPIQPPKLHGVVQQNGAGGEFGHLYWQFGTVFNLVCRVRGTNKQHPGD